jgi:hypothetical protein
MKQLFIELAEKFNEDVSKIGFTILALKYELDYVFDSSLLHKLELEKIIVKNYKTHKYVLNIEEQQLDWVDQYRLLFKGLKPRSMGDRVAVNKKMKAFLKKYPEFTPNDILKATKFYIENTDSKFIKQADYFIEKNRQSDLAATIEEMQVNVDTTEFDELE